MDAITMIEERRSIRKYKDTAVSEELIRKVVQLASNAPSWKNTQTSGYIAVTSAEKKNEIAEQATMKFSHNKDIINSATALIVLTTEDGICGYESDGSASTTKGSHWQSFDSGIAAQTFCLAAHELGLGTVILGMFSEEKVKEILAIPEGRSVSALIPLGYADESPDKRKRKEVDELLTIV